MVIFFCLKSSCMTCNMIIDFLIIINNVNSMIHHFLHSNEVQNSIKKNMRKLKSKKDNTKTSTTEKRGFANKNVSHLQQSTPCDYSNITRLDDVYAFNNDNHSADISDDFEVDTTQDFSNKKCNSQFLSTDMKNVCFSELDLCDAPSKKSKQFIPNKRIKIDSKEKKKVKNKDTSFDNNMNFFQNMNELYMKKNNLDSLKCKNEDILHAYNPTDVSGSSSRILRSSGKLTIQDTATNSQTSFQGKKQMKEKTQISIDDSNELEKTEKASRKIVMFDLTENNSTTDIGEISRREKIDFASTTHVCDDNDEEKTNFSVSNHESRDSSIQIDEMFLVAEDANSKNSKQKCDAIKSRKNEKIHIEVENSNFCENVNTLNIVENQFKAKILKDEMLSSTNSSSEDDMDISEIFKQQGSSKNEKNKVMQSNFTRDDENSARKDQSKSILNDDSIHKDELRVEFFMSDRSQVSESRYDIATKNNSGIQYNDRNIWLFMFPRMKYYEKKYETVLHLCKDFEYVCNTIVLTYKISNAAASFLKKFFRSDCISSDFTHNCNMYINSVLNMSFDDLNYINDILIQNHKKTLADLQKILEIRYVGNSKYCLFHQKILLKYFQRNEFEINYKNARKNKYQKFQNLKRVAEEALNYTELEVPIEDSKKLQNKIDSLIFGTVKGITLKSEYMSNDDKSENSSDFLNSKILDHYRHKKFSKYNELERNRDKKDLIVFTNNENQIESNCEGFLDADNLTMQNILCTFIFPENESDAEFLDEKLQFANKIIKDHCYRKGKAKKLHCDYFDGEKFKKVIANIIIIYVKYFKRILIENDRFNVFLKHINRQIEKSKFRNNYFSEIDKVFQ